MSRAKQTSQDQTTWTNEIRSYLRSWPQAWNRFWFAPSDPATLGLIRLLSGCMLVYTHLIWGKDLLGFFGDTGRLPASFTSTFYGEHAANWSYLYWLDGSPWLLWGIHLAGLAILVAYAIGYQTRVTSVLAFLITVAYANRAAGALFGLDQINGFLAMYCAIGPSGAAFSIDRWLQNRKARGRGESTAVVALPGATLSTRLIQVHMCIVYLFAGLGKLQGESWWNGEAFWGAVANAEYQSLDLTWLASHPWLVNLITHITIMWEVSYAALVWPKRTRPIVILMAIPLHLGIALGMGMMTFGLIMLVGNLSFVSPRLVRTVWARRPSVVRPSRAGEGASKRPSPTAKAS